MNMSRVALRRIGLRPCPLTYAIGDGAYEMYKQKEEYDQAKDAASHRLVVSEGR